MCPDKHNFINLNLHLPLKQQSQFVVCVSIAVAHCLKIKGLSGKSLDYSGVTAARIPLRSLEIYKPAEKKKTPTNK